VGWSGSQSCWEGKDTYSVLCLCLVVSLLAQAQTATTHRQPGFSPSNDEWSFYLNIAGYIIPHDRSYAAPTFTADRKQLHFGARYNYEDYHTGSFWLGYNINGGNTLSLEVTPMLGGVVGRTTGIAPGYLASVAWKQVELSTEGEYVFDTRQAAGSFFYSWMELSCSPAEWIRAGLVAERTKAYRTSLDIQRGFLIAVSHNRLEFTTYVFNAGWTDPTVVISAAFHF
jgi:hypothetical protein